MRPPALRWLALLLLAASGMTRAGTDYWSYSYRNIDVTAYGNGAYTVNLARSCARLDSMLSRILSIKGSYRPPTHVYALPAAEMKLFTSSDYSSVYRSSGYDTTVILDSTERPNGRPYWGAYFGYVATLLSSDRVLGGPDWYMVGVPEVFADVVFAGAKAKIGNVTPGFAYTLTTGGSLIPMRTFLTLKQHDAELKGKYYLDMYDAEAWYLAREVFVEGKHRPEFGKYLDLMRQGTAEPAAFAASFNVTYEDLDKELALGMREHAHVYIMDAPDDPAASHETAQPITAAELKGRLALLSARYQSGPDAVQLATEALRMEASNQSALRALALAQFAKGAYSESLAVVDQLSAQARSAAAFADSAYVLHGLASASSKGGASLPVDAQTLRRRAMEDYRRALAFDGEDRRSREGLTQLEGSQ